MPRCLPRSLLLSGPVHRWQVCVCRRRICRVICILYMCVWKYDWMHFVPLSATVGVFGELIKDAKGGGAVCCLVFGWVVYVYCFCVCIRFWVWFCVDSWLSIMYVCVCVCLTLTDVFAGGEPRSAAHPVGAPGDGYSTAAADRGPATDACRQGNPDLLISVTFLSLFGLRSSTAYLHAFWCRVFRKKYSVISNACLK